MKLYLFNIYFLQNIHAVKIKIRQTYCFQNIQNNRPITYFLPQILLDTSVFKYLPIFVYMLIFLNVRY